MAACGAVGRGFERGGKAHVRMSLWARSFILSVSLASAIVVDDGSISNLFRITSFWVGSTKNRLRTYNADLQREYLTAGETNVKG
jgi:hypothetical protein